MFEVIENEEPAKKLVKRDLALRYLDLNNNVSILKCTQLVPVLELLSNYFGSSSSSASSSCQLSYDNLNEANRNLILSILTNLIRSILEAKNPKSDDLKSYSDILAKTVKILSTLVKTSTKFVEEIYNSSHKLIDSLFDLAIQSEIKNDDKPVSSLELFNTDYKILLIILVHLSGQIEEKNEAIWSSLDEKLKKLIDRFKQQQQQITDSSYIWYLFIIHARMDKSIRVSNPVVIKIVDENFLFEYRERDTDEEKIQLRNFGLRYLKFLEDPKMMANCDQFMNIIYFMCSMDTWTVETILSEELKTYFVEMIVSVLKYLYKDLLHLLSKYEVQQDPDVAISEKKKRSLNGRIKKNLTLTEKLTTILQNFANASTTFCALYHRTGDGIKVLFDFIKNDFLSDFLVSTLTKSMSQLILKDAYESIIGSLHNLSRFNYKFKSVWDQCDAVEACIQFSNKLGSVDPHYRFYVYMIIANIASDSQIDTLPEIKVAIEQITHLIKSIAACFDDPNTPIKRTKIQFSEDDEEEEVAYMNSENNSEEWNLIELLEALYHMSVNDNIKVDIYNTYSMRDTLKKLIMRGNEMEREFSLRMLYQLCFDDEISDDVAKQTDLVEFIVAQSEFGPKLRRKRIAKNCDGIIWMIQQTDYCRQHQPAFLATKQFTRETSVSQKSLDDEKSKESTTTPLPPPHSAAQDPHKPGHIMISYNRESRDICLEIKSHLQSLGYTVWIDVEDIRGSSLESMAKAIEDSELVLMGMTEKYKLSANCRLEAEYAVNLNKPIIPLILQRDYKPDGWLGIILGSKMFINFKKYTFQECIERLKKEVETVYKSKKTASNNNETPHKPTNPPQQPQNDDKHDDGNNDENNKHHENEKPTTTNIQNEKVLHWSQSDVENWLQTKSIDTTIVDKLKPCDGKILFQMYRILQSAPEFFYYAMKTDANSSLKDLALFVYELTSLFREELH